MESDPKNAERPSDTAGRWSMSKRLKYWVDLAVKLTVPIGAALAAWLSLHFEDRASVRSLVNQREQAETSLKATMFGQLVGPIVGPLKDGQAPTDPMQYALLVRLLALNFNEDFEFGPLMQSADERLAASAGPNGPYSAPRIQTARDELRSVAHRVIDRQVARLWDDAASSCTGAGPTEITIFVLSKKLSDDELQGMGLKIPPGANDPLLSYVMNGPPDQLHDIVAPDCKDILNVSFRNWEWNSRAIDVDIERQSVAAPDTSQSYTFTLTPFSVPFSDNTPLSDGNRFALFENDAPELAAGGEAIHVMRVRLRWFPEYYYPPTERPANPKIAEQTLGIGPLGRKDSVNSR
jgi:hypothetical protein